MMTREAFGFSIWGKNCLPHAAFDSSNAVGKSNMLLEVHVNTVANISRLGESVANAVRNLMPHEKDKQQDRSLPDNPSSPGSRKKLPITDDLKQEWLEKYFSEDQGRPSDEWREAMKSLA
jgi:hypothetical protein